MDVFQAIQSLVNRAVVQRLIDPEDAVYCRNRLLNLLGLTEYEERDRRIWTFRSCWRF